MPIPYDDVEFFDHRAAPAGHTARDMALVGRVEDLESGGVTSVDLSAIQDQLDAQAAVDVAQAAVDAANEAVDDAQTAALADKEDAGLAATLDAALQTQITANADLNTAQQAAITANIAAIAALQVSIVKPDYEAAESDAAGILNLPDLTQSETFNLDKAAAGEYEQGVSRILWNGFQYALNTDAVLQAARGNSDTVDQTVLPSAGDGSLSSDWVSCSEPLSSYPYLFEADGITLHTSIQKDFARQLIGIDSRIVWDSRLNPSAYHNSLPHGASSGVLKATGTQFINGGSAIEAGLFQLDADLGAAVNIYQWGADGNGGEVKEISEAAIEYLKTMPVYGWLDYVDGDHSIASAINIFGNSNLTIYSSAGACLKKPDTQSTLAERQNSAIFRLTRGVDNVTIEHLQLKGNMTSLDASSGSQPLIMVGDYVSGLVAAAPTDTEVNNRVTIQHCEMSGSNWACVVFYGGQSGAFYQRNTNMTVRNCDISESSSGVFSYKNAENHIFEYNHIRNMAQNCISFDTRAASDPVEVSLPMYKMRANYNVCTGYGQSGQGSALLWKGLIFDSECFGNIVKDAFAASSVVPPHNVAIFAGPDFQGDAPARVRIINNRVSSVYSSGLNGIGIWCSTGVTRAHIEGNYVYDCMTISLYMNQASGVVKGNVFKYGNGFYHVRIEGASGNNINHIRYEDNVSDKTDEDGNLGSSTIGVRFAYIDDLWDSNNELVGGFGEQVIDVTRRNGVTL